MKTFLKIIAVLILAYLLCTFGLRVYTRAGQETKVISVKEFSIGNATGALREKGFEVIVTDTLWRGSKYRGKVLTQTPIAGTTVKEGRKVYLTIGGSIPPEVVIPSLNGRDDVELYTKSLKNREIGWTILEQSSDKFQPGTVISVQLNGQDITSQLGSLKVPATTSLTLVVSKEQE